MYSIVPIAVFVAGGWGSAQSPTPCEVWGVGLFSSHSISVPCTILLISFIAEIWADRPFTLDSGVHEAVKAQAISVNMSSSTQLSKPHVLDMKTKVKL